MPFVDAVTSVSIVSLVCNIDFDFNTLAQRAPNITESRAITVVSVKRRGKMTDCLDLLLLNCCFAELSPLRRL